MEDAYEKELQMRMEDAYEKDYKWRRIESNTMFLTCLYRKPDPSTSSCTRGPCRE